MLPVWSMHGLADLYIELILNGHVSATAAVPSAHRGAERPV